MAIKEEEKVCKRMRKVLDRQGMYPVKQNNGTYEYQRHGLSYGFARELEGYIFGYAEALGVKIMNYTLIKIRETCNSNDYYLLSIEFMDGRTF